MTISDQICLRETSLDDFPFLELLYAESHQEVFLPLGLNEFELNSLLRMQSRAQREGYLRDYPGADDRIIVRGDKNEGIPIGRILVDFQSDAIHLVDIALVCAARNAGIGTELIRELIARSEETGVPIRLEVRPGNRAFHLYSGLGFRVVGGGLQLAMEYAPGGRDEAQQVTGAVAFKPSRAKPLAGAEWDDRVGSRFLIDVATPSGPLALLLFSVDRRGGALNKSFSLTFHGPLSLVVPQGTYSLRLEERQGPERTDPEEHLIFIVPLGPQGNVMRYEAVFNS